MLKQPWILLLILVFVPTSRALAGTPKKPLITVADLPKLFDPDKLTDPKAAAAAVKQLEDAYQGQTQPEAVRMLIAILRGQLNGDSGWFGPAACC